MLKIFSHYGNTNQNHNEIPPHTYTWFQKNTNWKITTSKDVENWNPCLHFAGGNAK